jgi:hypothetical protein
MELAVVGFPHVVFRRCSESFEVGDPLARSKAALLTWGSPLGEYAQFVLF